MATEFSEELQRLFISFLLSDRELFVRCRNIVNPAYFLINLRPSVEFIVKHADDYSALPTIDQLKAKTKLEITIDDEVTVRHKEWFLDEFSNFAKHKALEIAILESADDIEKGEYYTVEDRIKKASEVSLTKNLGTSYFEDPMARLMRIKEKRGTVSSGWNALDKKLYGGFNKGELNIFAGGSGAGKSLFLQNLALNWVLAGLNVVYVTLELSEELTAMRIDSMITDVPTHDLFKNLENVDLKVRMSAKEAGALQLVYMPSGVNTSQIKAFLKEYEIQSKNYAHALLIDYLDLMMPNDRRVNPTDLFVKDKYVSEELRNLAVDLDIIFVTASQLNRSAVEEIEFDHSHIAGGLSKVQTADNVMGIFTSAPMRERGRYQIQFMKTRSSSGVGTRIDLGFNLETLRIEDLPEGEEVDIGISEDIYSNLQRKTTVQDDERSEPEEKALELRKLIKKLGT